MIIKDTDVSDSSFSHEGPHHKVYTKSDVFQKLLDSLTTKTQRPTLQKVYYNDETISNHALCQPLLIVVSCASGVLLRVLLRPTHVFKNSGKTAQIIIYKLGMMNCMAGKHGHYQAWETLKVSYKSRSS